MGRLHVSLTSRLSIEGAA